VLGDISINGLQIGDRAKNAAADALPRLLEKRFSTALSHDGREALIAYARTF
jgi:hypothetical protein